MQEESYLFSEVTAGQIGGQIGDKPPRFLSSKKPNILEWPRGGYPQPKSLDPLPCCILRLDTHFPEWKCLGIISLVHKPTLFGIGLEVAPLLLVWNHWTKAPAGLANEWGCHPVDEDAQKAGWGPLHQPPEVSRGIAQA